MAVLGSHFLDVAAELQQFLVIYVAPMAECDPGMVRAHNTLVNGVGDFAYNAIQRW
jgi:hypothetical protein